MKASSIIFDSVQRPGTFFGLPPRLSALAAGCAMAAFMTLVKTGAPASLAMAALFVTLPAGLVWCWRLRQLDHHLETLYPAARRFWRGKRAKQARTLLAGAPPPRLVRRKALR